MPLFMQKMAKIALWGIAPGQDWTGTCPCVSETESERVLTWFWIWWLKIRPFFLFYKVGVAKTVALPSHSKLKTIVVGSAWLIDFILRFTFFKLGKIDVNTGPMSRELQTKGNAKKNQFSIQPITTATQRFRFSWFEDTNKTLSYIYKILFS